MKFKVNEILEIPPGYCGEKCSPLVAREDVISVFSDKTSVGVWEPGVPCKKKCVLLGHKKKVTAVNTSPPDSRFLCSCSGDQVFLWDLHEVRTPVSQEGVLVGVDLGYVVHCEFSWDRRWLVLCRERQILIIHLQFASSDIGRDRLKDITTHGTINTGSAHCGLCAFSPQHSDVLVSVEENIFKVWNTNTLALISQSSSFGVHSLTFCVFDKTLPRMMLGTNKGMVYVYNTSNIDHAPPWNILSVDVDRTFVKNIAESHQEVLQCKDEDDEEEMGDAESGDYSSEASCIVISAQLFKRESLEEERHLEHVPTFNDETDSVSTYKLTVAPGSVLAVCCNLGIVLYDCKSSECLTYCYFHDVLQGISLCLIDYVVLGGESLSSLRCVLKDSSVGQRLRVISLSALESPEEAATGVSVMPDVPVSLKCPLRSHLSSTEVSAYEAVDKERGDQTRGRRTKSSGYGKQPPRVQMFMPRTNPSRTAKLRKPLPSGRFLLKCGSDVMNHCEPPSKLKEKVRVWETLGTFINLAPSGDGRQLACSSSLSEICILKFDSLNVDNSVNLIGHNAAINSLHFSLDSRLLVSASNDSSAKVWNWTHKKCVLTIDPSTTRTNGKRQDVISAARFYYMDQFVLLSTGGSLELYCHLLHEPSGNNRTLSSRQNHKRVHKVAVPAQYITCFTAANQFHSYQVLCGCSNKSVQVYDMNAERFSLEVKDVHSRPPHRVTQMTGSSSTTLHTPMYDMFVTSSICDGVKMWDLRTAGCVQRYTRHVNRSYTCGLDVSPCGRYLAVGSEDKAVYVYDTRRCEDYLGKLSGLGDVAMGVAFNPTRPLLAAAALNGYVLTYS